MVASTYHWFPLIGGHTGFPPWWYDVVSREIDRLPEKPSALQPLVDLTGVRWILVHRDMIQPLADEQWRRLSNGVSGVTEVFEDQSHLLLRVDLAARRPWTEALQSGTTTPMTSKLGTRRAAIAESRASARLERAGRPPAKVPRDHDVTLDFAIENTGTADWPVLAVPRQSDTGLVVVEATWTRVGAEGEDPLQARSRLNRDMLAGDRDDVRAKFKTPSAPGLYDLTVRVRQVDGANFSATRPLRDRIEVDETPKTPRRSKRGVKAD
jgi:hypothetical protein